MPSGELDITVSIRNVKAVVGALEGIRVRMDFATREAAVVAGAELQRRARANFHGEHFPGTWHIGGDAPNIETGTLQDSIRTWPAVQQGNGRWMVQVNPTAIYSRVIELGATIHPKHAEFLSWIGHRSDGTWGWIRKREVTVPPYPYLRPATESMLREAPPIFYKFWRDAWHA